ncbi:MAG TPA: glycosidase, partial [Erythrobacter sp.]|nr:glycosidase [Erythrobacter sp.]
GEPFTTLPQVDPGAQILLSVRSWPKVRQVFALIDAIEDVGIDPCDVAPDHWHHVHNRLAGGMQVRFYSPARHRDWLRRRKLQS